MTLGELIAELKKCDASKVVAHGFAKPHSYRGYYEDLAFEPMENVNVASMLEAAESALGKTFEGYKGGDYTMNEYTACWLSKYGESSGGAISRAALNCWLNH